ncbi:TspO/MBR family protein [Nocardia sp. NPDC051463]|uniref:TspO/MBR family protein n=1 Tax=Nocardia sp. NPDC051463 TaxID=3154845 RepID=UPI00344FB4A7
MDRLDNSYRPGESASRAGSNSFPYTWRSQALGAAVSVLLVLAAAATGSVSASSAASRYDSLTQPDWAPPSWLFGPVWTVLYALIATSAWWLWRARPWGEVRVPIMLYVVQLVLNGLWTPLFFGAEQRGLAFVEIIALTIAVAVTVIAFARHSRTAALLLMPYFAWTVFAASLNLSVWRLNT